MCVCAAETEKASSKICLVYKMIELCCTALPKKKKLIFFTASRKKLILAVTKKNLPGKPHVEPLANRVL